MKNIFSIKFIIVFTSTLFVLSMSAASNPICGTPAAKGMPKCSNVIGITGGDCIIVGSEVIHQCASINESNGNCCIEPSNGKNTVKPGKIKTAVQYSTTIQADKSSESLNNSQVKSTNTAPSKNTPYVSSKVTVQTESQSNSTSEDTSVTQSQLSEGGKTTTKTVPGNTAPLKCSPYGKTGLACKSR